MRLVAPPLAEGSKRRPSSLLKKGKPPTETVATCVGFSRGVDEASGEPLYRLRYDSGRLAGTHLHVLGADIAARAWPADAPPAPPLPSVRRGDVLAALRSVDLRPAGSPQGDVAALQAGATLRLGLGGASLGARANLTILLASYVVRALPRVPFSSLVVEAKRVEASTCPLTFGPHPGDAVGYTIRLRDDPVDDEGAAAALAALGFDALPRAGAGGPWRRPAGAASSPAVPPAAEAGRPRRTPSWLSMERLLADVAGHLQRAVLDVVLEAPGYREVRFLPLLVHLRWQVRQRL